jgi:hypothetical protein
MILERGFRRVSHPGARFGPEVLNDDLLDDNVLAVFDLIRSHASNPRAIPCAVDLLEVNGEDIKT